MLLYVAYIWEAHGIKGLLKLRSFTENTQDALSYPLVDELGKSYKFHFQRMLPKGVLLCSLEGCTSRTEAENLKGTKLYTDRKNMPPLDEDTFYYSDLEGLDVVDQKNTALGKVKAIHNYGAGVFMDVSLPAGGEATLPFRPDCTVDLEGRKLIIDASWLIHNTRDD